MGQDLATRLKTKVETLIARKLVQDDVAPRSALRVVMEGGKPAIEVA